MARHYTIKNFFRQIPNALLERYFHGLNLFTDLDFSTMKETKFDKLFTAWISLENERRNPIDRVFREIFEMSCEKGCLAIIDEAKIVFRGKSDELGAFIDILHALPNHYHRAMFTYLEHQKIWPGATHFYHADTISYWRKCKNIGCFPAFVDETNIKRLAKKLSEYFHFNEGRGVNCMAEAFCRNDLVYVFAYPEDYSQESVEWVNGELDPRPHNPAFEIIFIYSQERGTLDINCSGTKKTIIALRDIFATTILQLNELPPESKEQGIYALNFLCNRNFEFIIDKNSGIEWVRIKKLRLSRPH